MSLSANILTTTCDIYRNYPKGSLVEAGVPCQLLPAFVESGRTDITERPGWTHYALLNSDADVRDGYSGYDVGWSLSNSDTLLIPASGTTDYVVVFVELVGAGTAGEHKRVYLDRRAPAWPAL